MSARQLDLPGLRQRAEQPPLRARRDLSLIAFYRALARHGFIPVSDCMFRDRAGRYHEGVYYHRPIRIARRATLAKLLRANTGGSKP